MKYIIHSFYIVLFLSLTSLLFAQQNGNVVQFSGKGTDKVKELTYDTEGNLYIIGTFEEDLNTPLTSMQSKGGQDIFLVKMQPNMQLDWVRQYGGEMEDQAGSVAIGRENVFIAGNFSGTLNISGRKVESISNNDVFFASLDKSGSMQWTKSLQGTGNYRVVDMDTDLNNNLYLLMSYSGKINFFDRSFTSRSDIDLLLLKMGPQGRLVWIKEAGGIKDDDGASVKTDASGFVYVAGTFSGEVNIGEAEYTSSGNANVFLVKYNENGSIEWIQRSRGEHSDVVNGIVIDNQSDIYLTGSFERNIVFGSENRSSAADQDLFVVKYGPSGDVKWLNNASGGIAHDRAHGIAIDNENNFYLTGLYTHNITFIQKNLEGSESQEMFLAKYAPSGEVKQLERAGGVNTDQGNSVVARNGNIYVAGEFQNFASFNGTTLQSLNNSTDIFIWKMK